MSYDQHTSLPGKLQVTGDLLNQALPQNKMDFQTRSNQTNPAASNRPAVAQAAHVRQTLSEYTSGTVEKFSGESKAFLHFVRLIVNEAAALAWSTPYPHLLLPSLVDEKIQYARQWRDHQHRVANALNTVSKATHWETD